MQIQIMVMAINVTSHFNRLLYQIKHHHNFDNENQPDQYETYEK